MLILAAAIFAYMSLDLFTSENEVVDYVLFCQGVPDNTRCSGSWVRGERRVFDVNREQQTVVSQQEGLPPVRLRNCAVVDKQDWKCDAAETRDIQFGYVDGKFLNSWDESPSSGVRHVSEA